MPRSTKKSEDEPSNSGSRKDYRAALRDLQIELVKVQRHIIKHDHKVLVIFEGRMPAERTARSSASFSI